MKSERHKQIVTELRMLSKTAARLANELSALQPKPPRVPTALRCRNCDQPITYITRENATFFGHKFRPAMAIHANERTYLHQLREPSDSLRYRLRAKLEAKCRMKTTEPTQETK